MHLTSMPSPRTYRSLVTLTIILCLHLMALWALRSTGSHQSSQSSHYLTIFNLAPDMKKQQNKEIPPIEFAHKSKNTSSAPEKNTSNLYERVFLHRPPGTSFLIQSPLSRSWACLHKMEVSTQVSCWFSIPACRAGRG